MVFGTARLGSTWAQPALNIGPDCFHTGKHCALCLPQFTIALPGFARRISAQSSHTISHKSLLGRRPAVRRKPLNNLYSLARWAGTPFEKIRGPKQLYQNCHSESTTFCSDRRPTTSLSTTPGHSLGKSCRASAENVVQAPKIPW